MIYWLAAIAGLLLFDTLAMGLLKQFTVNNRYSLIAVALLLELIAWMFLIWGTKQRGLTITNAFWDIGSFVLVSSVALLLFKEKITARELIGLGLGLGAIVLLI